MKIIAVWINGVIIGFLGTVTFSAFTTRYEEIKKERESEEQTMARVKKRAEQKKYEIGYLNQFGNKSENGDTIIVGFRK